MAYRSHVPSSIHEDCLVLGTSQETLLSLLVRRIESQPNEPALFFKQAGRYVSVTWEVIGQDVRRAAAALVAFGVAPGDRVAHWSENRYQWIITDLAIQMARAVHVPMHVPLSGEQVVDQIVDSGACVVIVSTPELVGKLQGDAPRLPAELRVVSYEPCPAAKRGSEITPLANITTEVQENESRLVQDRALAELGPDSVATILYTSGTTGRPKGIKLSQRNLVSNATATADAHMWRADDRKLCFLPLSHIYARTCDVYTWLVRGFQLALAQSRDTVLANCREIQPTVISGVPYFYDRIYRQLPDGSQPGDLRNLLGGKVRECCSGGAPLADEVFDFFVQRGVPLLPGYGLTESSPVVTLSSPKACKRGTVGRPIPGVEVCIADDGEIKTRGPNVMVGFWKDSSDTEPVLRDGWLYTGDLGRLDADGFLTITGRKKELIVLAVGKNVVPTCLESLLGRDPLIDQALIVGDGRNFLTALIVPNVDRIRDHVATSRLAPDGPSLITSPGLQRIYQERIDQQLSGLSDHEQVRRITLLNRPFTIERGEVTPKRSLCRKVIEANFASQIEAMYQR